MKTISIFPDVIICYLKRFFIKGNKKKTCLRLHEYEMNQTQNNMAGFFFWSNTLPLKKSAPTI